MPDHTVHVYTSQTGYVGEYGLDICKTAATGEGRFFRVPWQLEEEFHRHRITPEHFRERYLAVLRERHASKPSIMHELVQQEHLVLTCCCKPGDICHRHFAAYALNRFAAKQGINTGRIVELVKDQPFPSDIRPYRLMIAGSRSANPRMIAFAEKLVTWASQQGWEIVVGDAPGVDTAVARACDEYNVHATVAGIAHQPRNGGAHLGSYTQIQGSYTDRDHQLCQWADQGWFIWDAASRGTRTGYEYLHSLGKPAILIKFAGGQNRDALPHIRDLQHRILAQGQTAS